MFKKLRNRFLIVNLVSISIMMLVAFVTIYTITYQNVQRETNMELYKVSDFYHSPFGLGAQQSRGEGQNGGAGVGTGTGTNSGSATVPSSPSRGGGNNSNGMSGGNFGGYRGPGGDFGAPPARSVSFMIQTDKQWKITDTHSRFDMEDSFYTQALQKVDQEKTGQGDSSRWTGQFALDGTDWAYVVDPSGDGHMIVFMDVTAQQVS